MAFGKVRVLREFGDVVDYTLEKPTTSVGRQPGNDIVLPTSAVSRYHARFDASEGKVYLEDLETVNGTFVNEKLVEPGSRVPLQNGDEIIMGDCRLLFQAPDTREYFSLTPSLMPIAEEGVPFRLMLDEPHQDVAPGARLNLVLLLENTGIEDTTYTISASGMDDEWVRLNWRELTLSPGQQAEVQVSIRPPRSATTEPGRYPLTVRVALKDDPMTKLEATRGIDIVGYNGFAMDVRQLEANGRYEVIVQNQGNQPTTIQFGGFNREGLLDYQFTPRQVEIAPGEIQRAQLNVKPTASGPLTGEEEVDFAVVARSLDNAAYQAPVPARYIHKASNVTKIAAFGAPVFAGASLMAILIIGALVLIGLPLLTDGGAPLAEPPEETTTPVVTQPITEDVSEVGAQDAEEPSDEMPTVILNFAAEPSTVTYRVVEPIEVTWEVTDAESVELFIGGDTQLALTPEEAEEGSRIISAEVLDNGEQEIRLRVVGPGGTPITESVTISVQLQICTIANERAIYRQPDPFSESLPPADTPNVVIIGRSADTEWVYVEYNNDDERGWVQRDFVECMPSAAPLDDFSIIDGQVPAEESTP